MAPVRVIAIVAAFNEADVIGSVVGALVADGIGVYLIDNRSTDGTLEVARTAAGSAWVGDEVFPPGEDVGTRFEWRRILQRKQELASRLDADWFIHHDADEFRESPWPGMGLRDGIDLVDRLGYNAIDFAVFNFWPSDDSFRPGDDPRSKLRRYLPGEDYDRVQVKCWKSQGARAVDLVHVGGHDVQFPGRKVFPIRFPLRHYPIRSEEHGRRKIMVERLPRYLSEERALGWHVQYDDVPRSFRRSHDQLEPWDGDAVGTGLQIHNRELESALREQKAIAATAEAERGRQSAVIDELQREVNERSASLAVAESEVVRLRDRERDLRAQEDARIAADAAERSRLHQRTMELETELSRSRDRLESSRRLLASIFVSRSWRWTASLRWLASRLRREA